MAKKLLALVSALALLVCAVSVFTIVSVSADAALDEFVAAEVEKHPAQLSEFSSNNDYWSGMWANWLNGVVAEEPVYGINIAAGANGGVTVAVKGAGSAKLGATLNSEYVLNGTHMVISAVTSETNTGFAIMFGSEKGGTPGAADSSTTGIVTFDFNAGTAVSNNHGSSGALSVIEASDVIKAMTAGASVISWGVADDGVVSITVTNAAGTVTGSIQDYPAAWTDRTKAYFSIVASGIDAKTNSVDVLAIHGGDAKCGAVIAAEEKEAARVEAFNALVEAEKTHYEALMAEWTGCNATYNNSDRHQMKESDEVGVNVWTKPHSTITVGAQTTSKIKLDGAHLVLDNITTTDPIVIGFSPMAYNEEGGSNWGSSNPIITIDLVAGDIRHNPPTTAATILSGSDVVKAMANGVSVVTFDVAENNAVTLTIENAAGVASATMPVEGENPAWADRTEAYLAITYRCTNDNGASFDIVAFHGGDETCGVDVEEEPDEPTTEEPPVTEEPVEIPDCTTYPSYVPTVDVLKNPGYWAGGAYESAVDVVAAEKGVTVKFSGAGNQTFRTYCTQTYNLDGLHISLRNLTGNGFAITFFSDDTATEAVETDVDYGTDALRFVNYATGTVDVLSTPWDGTASQTAALDAFTTDVDIMVKKLDNGDWEYSINGKAMTVAADRVAALIDDTSAVRVQFFENAWHQPAMGAHSFDVVALHDGLHADEKAAADKAEADKAAAKAVDDMVANLGEITLESGDAIQAAYDAYLALTDDQKVLVAADTLTNWTAAKAAYDELVAAAEADKAAAKAVDDMVANLGEITLESGDAIQAAYDAYLALTPAQQALVAADTLTNWQAAKDAYDALVAQQPGTETPPYEGPDCSVNPEYVQNAVDTVVVPGFWPAMLKGQEADKGVGVVFDGSSDPDVRTNSYKTFALDGLHIVIKNFNGTGLGVALTNNGGASIYNDNGLRFLNLTDGTVALLEAKWSANSTQKLTLGAFTDEIHINVKKLENGNWEYSLNGKAMEISAEFVNSVIEDVTAVHVIFFMEPNGQHVTKFTTASFDVAAIHNGACAETEEPPVTEDPPVTEEPSTEPAGPTLNTTEIIAGDSKFYKVNTDVIVSNNNYHTGVNIKLSDNDDGGVHCVLTAVGSARLGYNYTKEVTLNGTHVVISGLTATDEFAFILGKEPSVSENDHPAKNIFILYADGSARVYPGATQENPTIIEGSDSVRAFFNGVTTLISFAVDANGTVSVTVANEAGETTGTFSGYGEAWEDHTKAYIGFATNSANGVREFDIVAVHDGSVECGETINPDEAPVKAVEELIDAIGEEITLNSKDAIVAAVAAYEALTDAQKAMVANLDKLVAAVDAYSAIHYDQFRYKYNITVKVQKEEIDGYFGSKYDLETFDENNGLYVDHWMPIEDAMWANRAGYDFAVPLDGLQIVIKDFKSVKEAGQTISIGLMNDAGAWVDADAMIVWLLNSGKRETEGAGEYGYLHAESKKNGLAVSKALWQTDFATDIWAADELVIEFAYDAEGQTVGVFVNGQFMGDCTMEDLGITDPNKVIPHFGLWGAGNCKYAVYSITSKAQADKIQAAIDAIEALDPEAADFEEQVEAAADLYKALDKNLRNYVTNYDKLAEAIESIDPSDPTEEPTEDPTEDPTEEPENPKTGEAVAVLPIALLIAAAGAVIISRKRK